MSVVYYTASSLDGFIVDDEGSLAWLLSRDIDTAGPFGYDEFRAGLGAVVVGATTVRWVLEHEDGWPFTLPTWVLTHDESLADAGDAVRVFSGDVAELHPQVLESAGELDVWVMGGGDVARQYVEAGLVDEIQVSYAPCTLGAGAPVLPLSSEWRLDEVARNRDFVCARWLRASP